MNYFETWKDCWNFQKKYVEVEGSDSYWKALHDEAVAISKKHGESKFVNDLLIAVVKEFERTARDDNANSRV